MEIDNLEAFIKVAETKSFSRSAEALNVTQPAISKRIAALETKFRTKLFDRQGRTAQLTEAGHLLLPSARYIQSEVSRIREVSCTLDKSFHGTLALGTTPYTAVNHLAPALREFHHKFINVRIDMQTIDTKEVINNLLNNSIEIGLCSLLSAALEELPDSLLSMECWTERLYIVTSKNSSRSIQQGTDHHRVTGAQLAAMTAILPRPGTLERRIITNKLAQYQCNPIATPVDAPNFATMRLLAASGLGWTLLPESEIDDSLVRLEVENLELKQSVTLLQRSNGTLSRSANNFLELLPVHQPDAARRDAISLRYRSEVTTGRHACATLR